VAGGEIVRWQHNVGERRRGARVVVEGRWNSCRERDTVQSERQLVGAAWPEARRDGGSTTMSPEQLQREMEEMQRARGRRRGVRVFVP